MNNIASQIPTREIMWNINSLSNVIIMYSLFFLSLVIASIGIIRRVEYWLSGKEENFSVPFKKRLLDLGNFGWLQKKVSKDKIAGLAHGLIYLGFLVLMFTTTMVFIDHDLGIHIYQGNFYLAVTLLSDIFGVLLLVGLMILAKRRYFDKLDKLHTFSADHILLIGLGLLCVQGYIVEGLRIKVTQDPFAMYSPVGLLVAKLFWIFSNESAVVLHKINWWFHTLTVFICFALVPYSKFFHIITSSINLFFIDKGRPAGALKNPGDIEQMFESADEDFNIGVSSIKDYTWKQLLDLDTCTSCGRCQDVCPAYLSDKSLSPKWMILDTRNHMLKLGSEEKLNKSVIPKPLRKIDNFLTKNFFLKTSGLDIDSGTYINEGVDRSSNEAVNKAALKLGESVNQEIAGSVLNPDLFWACTTCRACVEVCPVGIDHVEQIVETRRNQVLMKGKMPQEAQSTLRDLETRTNPYGEPDERTNWIETLDVPILNEGDEVEYLYWVGCVSSYDKRKQEIARSIVKILNKSNVSWGILGNKENCTGDPARRLGEENLYQSLAKKNITTLKTIKFEKIVANCPHCFHTIKNEYPQIGNLQEGRTPEIIHHSHLINHLIDSKKISTSLDESSYTFHDPCYLGRYNNEYEAPRKALRNVKSLKIIEMQDNKEKGMCCGAGGGHYWMDIKKGKRINTIRSKQALDTKAEKIATACPFCMQMMEDGLKNNDNEVVQVKDIAEVIAEKLI